MTAPTRVVLIRHGHGLTNDDRILRDHDTCPGLSDRGRAQVLALRERLLVTRELADAAALLTSTTRRAVETAELLRDAVGGGTLAVERNCDLCDVHWGTRNGRSEDGLEELGAFDVVAEAGESWLGFMRRARRSLRDVARAYAGRTVVVVTHSGIVKSSYPAYGAAPVPADDPAFAGMTTWLHDGAGWSLVASDDVAYDTAEGIAP